MTRKLQEQNYTRTETKLMSILRWFMKTKTIPSGSVVPEVIHRAKRMLSDCELVVILGVLRTSSLVHGRDCWEKNNPEGKRSFEGRGGPNVIAQISWCLEALEPLWGCGEGGRGITWKTEKSCGAACLLQAEQVTSVSSCAGFVKAMVAAQVTLADWDF